MGMLMVARLEVVADAMETSLPQVMESPCGLVMVRVPLSTASTVRGTGLS